MIFYHGTTKEGLNRIFSEGELFGYRGENVGRCTYLTTDIEEAKCYGEVLLKVSYDPKEHPELNNYVEGCWQFRVYEPINLKFIEVL